MKRLQGFLLAAIFLLLGLSAKLYFQKSKIEELESSLSDRNSQLISFMGKVDELKKSNKKSSPQLAVENNDNPAYDNEAMTQNIKGEKIEGDGINKNSNYGGDRAVESSGPVDEVDVYSEPQINKDLEESLMYLSSLGELSSSELKGQLDNIYSDAPDNYTEGSLNQTAVQNAFSTDVELSEFALIDNECKQSLCRLSVAVADFKSSNNLMQELAASLADSNTSFSGASVLSSPNLQDGKVTLYVLGIEHQSEKGFSSR